MKDTDKVEKAFQKGSIDLFLAAIRIFSSKELKLTTEEIFLIRSLERKEDRQALVAFQW